MPSAELNTRKISRSLKGHIHRYIFTCTLGSDRNFGSVRIGKKSEVRFGFGKNSWFGRFLVCVRKRPKFRFGSGFGWFWPVRFGKKNRRFGLVRVRQKFLVRSFHSVHTGISTRVHTCIFTGIQCTHRYIYTCTHLKRDIIIMIPFSLRAIQLQPITE